MSDPSVAFIGLGYIGLPTAVIMANHGLTVTGIDVKREAVERINRGQVTIVEPGLQEQLRQALGSGRFTARTEPCQADIYVLAVPTPFTTDQKADLSYVFSAAESLAPLLRGGELIILESTSPPGATRQLADRVLALRPDLAADGSPDAGGKPVIYFAHCPERILPGRAMEELITNDRIIGGLSPEATRKAQALYSTFCTGQLLPTDATTAELAKLTENSYRDVNIAFANELSVIAENLGVDVWELIDLANHHPRVNILQPGPGVGGHCIAVDPWFIVAADPENARLIRTAREVNDAKPQHVLDRVEAAAQGLNNPVIAALGLTFKANIDDLRESPALAIVQQLAQSQPGSKILVAEPNIQALPSALAGFPHLSLTDYREAIEQADIILLLVDHQEFHDLPATALAGKNVIDTKGLWR